MKTATLFLTVALSGAAFVTQAQERPYREGPVTEISFVKVKPGKFDEYMAYLAGPYRELMEPTGRRASSSATASMAHAPAIPASRIST